MQNNVTDRAVRLGKKILQNSVIEDYIVQILRAGQHMGAHEFSTLLLSPSLQHEQVAVTGEAAEIAVLDQFTRAEPQQPGDRARDAEVNQDPARIMVEHAAKCAQRGTGQGEGLD